MRPSVQISVIPDGQVSRVHAAIFDLDELHRAVPIIEWTFDSGIMPPTDPREAVKYMARITRQLHARVMLSLAPEDRPLGELVQSYVRDVQADV